MNSLSSQYDFLVIGAGIYGLYSAYLLGQKGYRVILIDCEDKPFQRASYINQARVHMGYHYPRSISTASLSADYFQRFCTDFSEAINGEFKKIYAIAARASLTSARQFVRFCEFCGIPSKEINTSQYFDSTMIESAYETTEYAFDARILSALLIQRLKQYKNIDLFFGHTLENVTELDDLYRLKLIDKNGKASHLNVMGVINATYASINQILEKFNCNPYNIKYEMAEIILVNVCNELTDVGITVMDGPFFSIMPFGKDQFHSLTSVEFTPHKTSYETLPTFDCQKENDRCSKNFLDNCNNCNAKPKTSYRYMSQLAKKYLHKDLSFDYKTSLFTIKSILNSSELDDSRPTIIRQHSTKPLFISVLSGKINTIYELEEALNAI